MLSLEATEKASWVDKEEQVESETRNSGLRGGGRISSEGPGKLQARYS